MKARGCILENSNKLILVPGLELIEFDPLSTSEPFVTGAGMFGGKVIKVDKMKNQIYMYPKTTYTTGTSP